GGMGSAVAEFLGQEYPVPMKIMGIQDVFGQSARSYKELLEKYGLTAENVIRDAE
ncbi:MAG: transketolase family protein, partial [Microgenomates group bacterium]